MGDHLEFFSYSLWFCGQTSTFGAWRLASRTIVYERDRLDPVHPDQVPDGYFDDIDFGEFRQPVRFLDWRLSKKGIPAAKSILTINSPEEEALIADSLAWLKGG